MLSMAVTNTLGVFIGLTSLVYMCNGLCQLHPVNNSREVCEARFNIQRHEMVGGLKTQAEVADLCRTTQEAYLIAATNFLVVEEIKYSVYPKYEECLKELIKDCPPGESFLDMQGYDQKSTVIAFKGFCADKDVYLSGVACYTRSFPAIGECFKAHSAGRDEAQWKVHSDREWDKFYQSLCPIQWEGAGCIANSVKTCSTSIQKTIKNLAYSLMHGRCKIPEYGTFVSDYDKKYGSSATKLSPLCVSLVLLIAFISLMGKV